MRECREDDVKGMISVIEGVWIMVGRNISRSIRDGICACLVVVVVAVVLVVVVVLIVAMGVMGVVVLMVVVGIVVLVMVVRVVCIGVVRVVGVLCIGVLEVDCVGVVVILVLGAVFLVEVVEGVELVVGCVVRRVVRIVLNVRGCFLRCFSLKLVEMNGLSVGRSLFGMVIWANCIILLECGFLDKMVGADVLLDVVVVEVVVVETVDVVQV